MKAEDDGKPLYTVRHRKDPHSDWTTFIKIRGKRLRWIENVIDTVALWWNPPQLSEDNLEEYESKR